MKQLPGLFGLGQRLHAPPAQRRRKWRPRPMKQWECEMILGRYGR